MSSLNPKSGLLKLLLFFFCIQSLLYPANAYADGARTTAELRAALLICATAFSSLAPKVDAQQADKVAPPAAAVVKTEVAKTPVAPPAVAVVPGSDKTGQAAPALTQRDRIDATIKAFENFDPAAREKAVKDAEALATPKDNYNPPTAGEKQSTAVRLFTKLSDDKIASRELLVGAGAATVLLGSWVLAKYKIRKQAKRTYNDALDVEEHLAKTLEIQERTADRSLKYLGAQDGVVVALAGLDEKTRMNLLEGLKDLDPAMSGKIENLIRNGLSAEDAKENTLSVATAVDQLLTQYEKFRETIEAKGPELSLLLGAVHSPNAHRALPSREQIESDSREFDSGAEQALHVLKATSDASIGFQKELAFILETSGKVIGASSRKDLREAEKFVEWLNSPAQDGLLQRLAVRSTELAFGTKASRVVYYSIWPFSVSKILWPARMLTYGGLWTAAQAHRLYDKELPIYLRTLLGQRPTPERDFLILDASKLMALNPFNLTLLKNLGKGGLLLAVALGPAMTYSMYDAEQKQEALDAASEQAKRAEMLRSMLAPLPWKVITRDVAYRLDKAWKEVEATKELFPTFQTGTAAEYDPSLIEVEVWILTTILERLKDLPAGSVVPHDEDFYVSVARKMLKASGNETDLENTAHALGTVAFHALDTPETGPKQEAMQTLMRTFQVQLTTIIQDLEKEFKAKNGPDAIYIIDLQVVRQRLLERLEKEVKPAAKTDAAG